jgi:hypothetical protein
MTFSEWNLCCLPGTAVSQCSFVCLVDITRETGIRSGGKYKSELKGKASPREQTQPQLLNIFNRFPSGTEPTGFRFSATVNLARLPPPRTVAMGKKTRPLVPHGRVFACISSRARLALVGGVLGDGRLPCRT